VLVRLTTATLIQFMFKDKADPATLYQKLWLPWHNSLILFASDHRGYELKSKLIVWAAEQGYPTKDLGPDRVERCDAGDFATRLATELMSKPGQFGVLICGTGLARAGRPTSPGTWNSCSRLCVAASRVSTIPKEIPDGQNA